MTIPGLENPPTAEQEAAGVGRAGRGPDPAGPHRVGRRLAGGVGPPHPADGRRRDGHPAEPREAPELLPVPLRPQRRGPRRGPHLHLLAARSATPARPTTGRDPAEMRDDPHGPVRRLHARAHHVRRSRSRMGPLGSPDLAAGRRDHRLALRRGQHADHDPHGQGRPRPDRRPTATSSRPCTRSGYPLVDARATRDGRARGRAATPSTSSTSPRPARSGPSAPATAATRCWARSASRCASPRRWPATRAGWPSTC